MTFSNVNSFGDWARNNLGGWLWGTLPAPGSALGLALPERAERPFPGWLQRLHESALLRLRAWPARRRRIRRVLDAIEAGRGQWRGLDDAGLLREAQVTRQALGRGLLSDDVLVRTFTLIDECLLRARGFHYHRVQLQAGLHMVFGQLVEMATGEGKTLTAILPAATHALAGCSVHVVTVNDYLTARDADEVRPILQRLGLSVAHVVHDLSPQAKRQAYDADITYATNKELVFDYLRDRAREIARGPLAGQLWLNAQQLQPPLVRHLDFALVDEADSVLIDEANIPLILTEPTPQALSETFLRQAIELADHPDRSLWEQSDLLGSQGVRPEAMRRLVSSLPAPAVEWQSQALAQEILSQAKLARERYKLDVQYILEDGKIVLIDEQTGRPMPDRSLPWGLQQIIEVREGLPPSANRKTLAKLSFQRFFRKYHRLSGMSGTLQEVRGELRTIYGLPVVPIPTHREVRRHCQQQHLFASETLKLEWALERCRALLQQQRAVLIGVNSVALSERLSRRLDEAGLPHGLLNARRLKDEADLVTRAGCSGQVNVVTNMAGRGTDIKLEPAVHQAGGLHVMVLDVLESARLDRQLFGRAGRQGDPGSYDIAHSLDEPKLRQLLGSYLTGLLNRLPVGLSTWRVPLYFRLLSAMRSRLERHKRNQRIHLLENESHRDDLLSFTRRL